MSALTEERDTRRRGPNTESHHVYPVAATVKIYMGAMVALTATGFATPASAPGPTQTVIGRASATVDNSSGADGDLKVEVGSHATFDWDNLEADPVVAATVGKRCYAADDQTVALTDGGGTRPVAGYVESIDPDTTRVWVIHQPHAI